MAWKKIQWSDDAAAVTVRKNSGSNIGTRPRLNFIEGSNITLAISDDAGGDEIDISIAASGGGVTDHGALTGLADYDHDQYLRRNGAQAMTGDLDIGNNDIVDVDDIRGASVTGTTTIFGGPSTSKAPTLSLCGKDHPATPGEIQMSVPDAAETSLINVIRITGCTDTPIVKVYRGLDMNDNTIKDMKNSAASALSGTQKDIEIDIGGTAYYFTVYPTKV